MEDVDSDTSLDYELGIGALEIPGMEKAMKDTNKKLRRSDRQKKTVEIFGYDTYTLLLPSYHVKKHFLHPYGAETSLWLHSQQVVFSRLPSLQPVQMFHHNQFLASGHIPLPQVLLYVY